MATRCTKCGTFLTDGERFCPNCGENAPQPVVPPPTAPSPVPQQYTPYGQNGMNGQGGTAGGYPAPTPVSLPSYNPAYNTQPAEEMSLGKWVGLILLTNLLGFISVILLFVWGFSSGPKARQNYCRAMLIFKAITIVLGVILSVIFASALVPFMEGIANGGMDYENFYNEFYGEFTAFFSGLFR